MCIRFPVKIVQKRCLRVVALVIHTDGNVDNPCLGFSRLEYETRICANITLL